VINLCERNGESLVNVLGECSRLLPGEDGRGIRELFTSVFDSLVKEKGFRTAFAKLVSEETWEERINAMRVPDWIYLLFKLKALISDSAWQDLTNLARLGRTGVS